MTDANVPPVPEGAENLAKQGIDVLIQDLAQQRRSASRRYAVYILGNARTPQAIRPLIEALGDMDKSYGSRRCLRWSPQGRPRSNLLPML